jgi:hypothetical protein
MRWLEWELSMSPEHVRRNAKRAVVHMPARLRHKGLEAAEVTILDLSFTGFKAASDIDFTPGVYLSIDLPGIGLVRSKVVWCKDGQVGCSFNNPVDVRRCLL